MDFDPFIICSPGERAPRPRPINTPDGLGDRMRTAAFAELQAMVAFRWAAVQFPDAPATLRDKWTAQIADETRHYEMICRRMEELGFELAGQPVSTSLWESLKVCTTGRDFCIRIASAEERGRQAGVRMVNYLGKSDPETAAIFQEIVDDEVAHVALAATFFDWVPE